MHQARKQQVYLCGPIANCTDAECTDWRQLASQALDLRGHATLDPLATDYRGREERHWQELVEKDLAMIRDCDVVLANLWKHSPGSSMELVYARQLGKPVFAAVPNPVHPWIRYHASFLTATIDDAIEETANYLHLLTLHAPCANTATSPSQTQRGA